MTHSCGFLLGKEFADFKAFFSPIYSLLSLQGCVLGNRLVPRWAQKATNLHAVALESHMWSPRSGD